MHYRSIFVSDCHFGFHHNRSDLLADFLKKHSCDNLYLVGDIIDIWELERKFRWSLHDSLALRQMLNMQKHGSKLTYIVGNHDGYLRSIMKYLSFEGIRIGNEFVHEGVDGRKHLVVHGDLFDNAKPVWIVLSKMGAKAYDYSITVSIWINKIRRLFGKENWSLSGFLKNRVKGVANYILKYERHMIEYCKEKGYDGVICGHIHHPIICMKGTLAYYNCGDWIESNTALVEHEDGRFEIIYWSENGKNDQVRSV